MKSPTNFQRLFHLLKYLRAVKDNRGVNDVIADEEVQGDYDVLKRASCRLRQEMIENDKQLKVLSWREVGLQDPSLQKRAVLALEAKAWAAGIALFRCEKMWGADRFMFEAFRGGSKDRKASAASGSAMSLQEESSTFML